MTQNEVLQAIIDGKEIQIKILKNWVSLTKSEAIKYVFQMEIFSETYVFRIKPEVIPDFVQRKSIYCPEEGTIYFLTSSQPIFNEAIYTFDAERRDLKEIAQVGKPSPQKMEALLRSILNQSQSHSVYHKIIKEVLENITE
jgi:hypothetical protein